MRSADGEPGIRIFLSYAREDERPAGALVGWLRERGFEVFWDQDLPPGVDWAQLLAQELSRANCLLVLWTAASIQSQWVRNEADEAMHLGKLWPLLLEPVRPPLSFRHLNAIDLEGWVGDAADPRLERLARTLRRLFGAGDEASTTTTVAAPSRASVPDQPPPIERATRPMPRADAPDSEFEPEADGSIAPGLRARRSFPVEPTVDPPAEPLVEPPVEPPASGPSPPAAPSDHPEAAPLFPFPESLATGPGPGRPVDADARGNPTPAPAIATDSSPPADRTVEHSTAEARNDDKDRRARDDASAARRRIIGLAVVAGLVFVAVVAAGLSGWRPWGERAGPAEGLPRPASAPASAPHGAASAAVAPAAPPSAAPSAAVPASAPASVPRASGTAGSAPPATAPGSQPVRPDPPVTRPVGGATPRPARCDRLVAESQIRALRADERQFLSTQCR